MLSGWEAHPFSQETLFLNICKAQKAWSKKMPQPQVRVGRRCIFYCFKTGCSNKCTWGWNIFSSAWLVCEKSVERSKSSRAGCSVWPVSDARRLWSLTPARNQKYPLAIFRRIYRVSTGSESLLIRQFLLPDPSRHALRGHGTSDSIVSAR